MIPISASVPGRPISFRPIWHWQPRLPVFVRRSWVQASAGRLPACCEVCRVYAQRPVFPQRRLLGGRLRCEQISQGSLLFWLLAWEGFPQRRQKGRVCQCLWQMLAGEDMGQCRNPSLYRLLFMTFLGDMTFCLCPWQTLQKEKDSMDERERNGESDLRTKSTKNKPAELLATFSVFYFF